MKRVLLALGVTFLLFFFIGAEKEARNKPPPGRRCPEQVLVCLDETSCAAVPSDHEAFSEMRARCLEEGRKHNDYGCLYKVYRTEDGDIGIICGPAEKLKMVDSGAGGA